MIKKELIISYLEDGANEKQIEFIYNLLSLPEYCNKLDLLRLAGVDKKEMNFDTAYPIGIYDSIKPYYTNIDKANLIYDYTNNNYGELVNINDILTTNILNLKK